MSSMTDWKVSLEILVEEKILNRKRKKETPPRHSMLNYFTQILLSYFSPIPFNVQNVCTHLNFIVEKRGQVVVQSEDEKSREVGTRD